MCGGVLFACMYACAPDASLVPTEDQKRTSDLLELELQLLGSHLVAAGNHTCHIAAGNHVLGPQEEQLELLTAEPSLQPSSMELSCLKPFMEAIGETVPFPRTEHSTRLTS